MKPKKIKQMLAEESIKDSWWLSIDGEIQKERVQLATLLKERKRLEPHRIRIMHGGLSIEPHSEWIDFEYPKRRTGLTRPPMKKPAEKTASTDDQSKELATIERLKAELAERQKFIEQSERKLMRKAMEMEVRQAELEQMSEDVQRQKKSAENFPSYKVLSGGRQSESA